MELLSKTELKNAKLRKTMLKKFNRKTFIGESGNHYRVEEGRFIYENKSAEIDMIGSLYEEYYLTFISSGPDVTTPIFKERLEYLIKNFYHPPRIGRYIAVTFTDEYAELNQRYGYITSRIKEIQRTQ